MQLKFQFNRVEHKKSFMPMRPSQTRGCLLPLNTFNNEFSTILVKKVEEDTLLLGLVEDNTNYDFCMCNPPFYSDHLEAQGITTSRSDDRPEPMSVSTASEVESISWGGEVKFVSRMIEESLVLKNRIR